MSNSTYEAAIDLVKEAIDDLNIQLNGGAVPCVVRKLPLRQEVVDPSTQIIVSPGNAAEGYKRLAFGGHYEFSPLIQVVLVSPNNGDQISNLDDYLDVREQIAAALSDLPIGLRSSIEYDPPLDRYEWLDNVGNTLLYGYLLDDELHECRQEDFPDEVDAVAVIDSWTGEMALVDAGDIWD